MHNVWHDRTIKTARRIPHKTIVSFKKPDQYRGGHWTSTSYSATLRRRKRVFGFTASQLQSSAFQKIKTRRSKQHHWHCSSPSSMNFKSWIRHIEATHPKKHKTASPGFKQRVLMRNLRLHSHCTDTMISHI